MPTMNNKFLADIDYITTHLMLTAHSSQTFPVYNSIDEIESDLERRFGRKCDRLAEFIYKNQNTRR